MDEIPLGLERDVRSELSRSRRRQAIILGAIRVAKRVGYRNMTRRDVALAAGVADGSINHEFGTMQGLRDAVMADAVANERFDIIAQGIADRHPAALKAPSKTREAAIRSVA